MKRYDQLTETEQQALARAYREGKLEILGAFGDWRKASSKLLGRGAGFHSAKKSGVAEYKFMDDCFYRIAE